MAKIIRWQYSCTSTGCKDKHEHTETWERYEERNAPATREDDNETIPSVWQSIYNLEISSQKESGILKLEFMQKTKVFKNTAGTFCIGTISGYEITEEG